MPSTVHQELKLAVRKQRDKIAELEQELTALLKTCTHEELREVVQYFSGNPHDKPFTRVYDECLVCKKRLNARTETHPYDKD